MKTVKIDDELYEAIKDIARATGSQIQELTETILRQHVESVDLAKIRKHLEQAAKAAS